MLITHKINLLAIADKIMVMAGGAVQGYGPRDEIISQLMGPRIVPFEAPVSSAGEGITDSTRIPLCG